MSHPTFTPSHLSVYLVIDPTLTPQGKMDSVLEQACLGGVTLVQVRCKNIDTKNFMAHAHRAKSICQRHDIPLLINDRIDIALAIGADGVHLGQDDMPVPMARALLGEDKIIGLTIRTESEAQACPTDLVDYASIGAVFATNSKTVTTAKIGLSGLTHLTNLIRQNNNRLPVCAISGITADNAGDVIACGIDGISVITTITQSPFPKIATQQLKKVVEQAKIHLKTA